MNGRYAWKNPLKFFKFHSLKPLEHPTHNRVIEGSSPSRPTIYFHWIHMVTGIFTLGPSDYKSGYLWSASLGSWLLPFEINHLWLTHLKSLNGLITSNIFISTWVNGQCKNRVKFGCNLTFWLNALDPTFHPSGYTLYILNRSQRFNRNGINFIMNMIFDGAEDAKKNTYHTFEKHIAWSPKLPGKYPKQGVQRKM